MPTIIDTTVSSGVNIGATETVVVTQTGTIETSAFASLTFDVSGTTAHAIVAGTIVASATPSISGIGVWMRGEFDQLTVGPTGQIYALGLGADGILVQGERHQIVIDGLVQSNDFAVYGISSSDAGSTLTIGPAGTIIGGSDRDDSDNFSAAIGMMAENTSGSLIINHGSIIGEYNAAYGSRTAILNASELSSGFRQFDGSDVARMTVENSGTITGDLFLAAGDDAVSNTGAIDGSIFLGDGNDVYNGRGGFTDGAVYGGDGFDSFFGGDLGDRFFDAAGDDRHFGLDGDDSIVTGLGNDTLYGGAGNDELMGEANADLIYGGSGDDSIDGGTGTDEIYGNSGDDTIVGGSADDTIRGGSGSDDIRGGSNADEISGNSGDDLLRGESGSDSIGGGGGDDILSGSTGNDSLDGGSGDDRLFGGDNNDVLEGTLGLDYLDGGTGDDLLRGGSHDDTLDGGTGQDTLDGGHGADRFVFGGESDSPHSGARDLIVDFEAGVDLIDLSGFAGTLTYVGSYTGTAGEVRYNDAVGRLYVDVDGDSASDFSVDLTAGSGLTADDLIL